MELLTLDSNFQPVRMVENYASCIWTERYSTAGDFEIQTTDVENMLKLLPRETYVSLRESTVPMIVETHKIEKNPQSAPKLTIKGRSFETVLERRASVNQLLPAGVVRPTWLMPAQKESDAAYKAMRMVIGDIDRGAGLPAILPAALVSPNDVIPQINLTLPADFGPNPPAWSSVTPYVIDAVVQNAGLYWKAKVPNTNVTPAAGATWQALSYEIPAADLYSTVLNLIAANRHGIKAVRPGPTGTQVGVEIYNGANLTSTVVFDARFDQFDSSAYLFSEQGSTNVGYVYGSNGGQVVLKTAAAEPSGLARRVLLVDQTTNAALNSTDTRKGAGLVELYKYNATALFDGEISVQVAAGYNSKYFLGDIVRLNGEYGLTTDVRVAEFIRSSDNTGEKAYPTFEATDSVPPSVPVGP